MTGVLDRLAAALASRYTIERELGHGGMATVYLALDLKHHRKVALKVLRPELAAALGSERFLREITLTAALHHPHILPLLDSGDADGQLFYAMPFVEGESLRDRLHREPQLPLEDALQIAREVADALAYAHSHDVVHRDVKPENILLESGHALVADFGIARAITAAGGEKLTETGIAVGTPAYMSPEQGAGSQDLDGRSDLYSLGCVLYEMLAGHPPFAGTSAHELLARHAMDPVPPLRTGRATVPEPIEAAIERALAKVPADRYATAHKFATALAIDPAAFRQKQRRRKRVRRAVIGVMVVLVTAVAVWTVRRGGIARQRAPIDSRTIPLDSSAIAVLPFQVIGADSGSPARTLARFMGDYFDLKVSSEFGRRISHPGSVAQRWRDAGGTLDSGLSEETELAIARAVGAGRLVRGTVTALRESLIVSASVVDVATGAVRVPQLHVKGTIAGQQDLVDQMIVLLLARDQGIPAERAPSLKRYKPEAIQAWLAGDRAALFSGDAKRYYRAALAADSNLVDAAFAIWADGEAAEDSAELRLAWEHQDQLTERGRAYLQPLAAGRFGGIRTEAGKIAAYEAITRRWPEWTTAWNELGSEIGVQGALSSVPDWRRWARRALERSGRPGGYAYWHLTELAFQEQDTAWARAAAESLLVHARDVDFLPRRAPAYRWRLAMLRGDTADAARILSQLPDSGWVYRFALTDGRGVAQADRAALVGARDDDLWWWARGKERLWREAWRMAAAQYYGDLDQATAPIYRALLLGGSEDRMVVEELRRLERMARGGATPPVAEDDQTLARCWVTLWRLRHGDTTTGSATTRYLEGDPDRRARFAGWARLFDVLLTVARGGDARGPLLRMDSVVRELPLPSGHARWYPWPAEVQNLLLAQLLRRFREPELALAAVRRRLYAAPFMVQFVALPEYLREEGRLAAIVGDTVGAIRAYNHYLALRENPDPLWRAPWDSVRAELAALVAR